jgi:hypothetical protein
MIVTTWERTLSVFIGQITFCNQAYKKSPRARALFVRSLGPRLQANEIFFGRETFFDPCPHRERDYRIGSNF